MGNAERATEPNMEEILASIRRIISDDESDSARPSHASATVSRIISDDESGSAQPSTSASQQGGENIEDRKKEADERIISDIARILSDTAPPVKEFVQTDVPTSVQEFMPQFQPEPSSFVTRSTRDSEQGTSSFNALHKTLEGEIKDMLRPMLRQWLDENMPHVLSETIPDSKYGLSLRVPTVDERVNLYLRAVHGKRVFTYEETSRARERVLDAMAADIATRLALSSGDA